MNEPRKSNWIDILGGGIAVGCATVIGFMAGGVATKGSGGNPLWLLVGSILGMIAGFRLRAFWIRLDR